MNIVRRQISQKNYADGRQGHRIQAIVVHIMEGSMNGTLAWFRNPASEVSAHYGISKKGEIVQYVDDEDTAQHAGLVVRPTARLIRLNPGVNPNLWTIGIEHEGRANQDPPEAQMVASAELIAHLSRKHGIPIDDEHVIPHRAIRADKTCPGRISVQTLISLARKAGTPTEAVPQPGERRYSRTLGEPVILTRYESDEQWYFLRESELAKLGRPASSPWSAMPRTIEP